MHVQVLASLPPEFSAKHSIARWLAQQTPEKLRDGFFQVPKPYRTPEGHERFLTSLGFQLVQVRLCWFFFVPKVFLLPVYFRQCPILLDLHSRAAFCSIGAYPLNKRQLLCQQLANM